MKELKGKRLLVLGGSLWKEAIKQFADKNEITLIAAGNNTNAGIFKIAKEGYKVDSTDSEKMKDLIRSKHIDGVYMGGSEAVISAACGYINELGYPCYCTKKQWELLQNKKEFKELCQKFGLPVVPKYDIKEKDLKEIAKIIEFPVITKPADGCGSNGFSVCKNVDELKRGYKFANENSVSGEVIVEKFVDNKGIGVFYTFSDGKMIFSGLEDKYPMQYIENGSYVGGMYTFESKFKNEFRNLFEDKLKRMFNYIGLKEGGIWIEIFIDNNKYYFNEVGFRCGGSISIYPVDYFYGINQTASDIYYALSGKSRIYGNPSLIPLSLQRKRKYCVYPVYIRSGKIMTISGIEEIKSMNNVIAMICRKSEGEYIEESGNFSQNFAMVHFVYDNQSEFLNTIREIDKRLEVFDENGKQMTITHKEEFLYAISEG